MNNKIIQIPVEKLTGHSENKKYFHSLTGGDYALLYHSIAAQGILTPLLVAAHSVTAEDSTYTVLSGHQRLRCALDLEIKAVPCITTGPHDPAQQLDILTQANLGRSISIAERYKIAERLLELEKDGRKDNHGGGVLILPKMGRIKNPSATGWLSRRG